MSAGIKKCNRPRAPIIGAEGGLANILAIAQCVLRRKGYRRKAYEMAWRVKKAKSYEHALAIVQEYVAPVPAASDGR